MFPSSSPKPVVSRIGARSVVQPAVRKVGVLACCCLLLGANVGKAPVVLEPVADGVITYYSAGRPYGVVAGGGLSFILSLDRALVGSKTYSRLWIYCRNDSSYTVDFDPTEWITYTIETTQSFEAGFDKIRWLEYNVLPLSDGAIPVLKPEPAWSLINRVKAKGVQSELWAILGASLAGLATAIAPPQDTRVTIQSNTSGESATATIHDGGDKARAEQNRIARRLADNLGEIRASARSDAAVLNQSVLRRDSLGPGMAVAGFIYFPDLPQLPGQIEVVKKNRQPVTRDTIEKLLAVDWSKAKHLINVRLPSGGSADIRFRPVEAR